MPRFVALLGGINVGGHRVKMDRLRAEFESLGFTDVSTFIASGNVIFRAPSARARESRIADHLHEQLGFPVPTFVRTAAALVAAADLRPFAEVSGNQIDPATESSSAPAFTHMVAFCRDAPDSAAAAAIEATGTDVDRFEVHGTEVHWLIEGGLMSSKVTLPRLAQLIGPNTTRNITSLSRLADLVR